MATLIQLEQYQTQEALPLAERAADLLDWAAQNFPESWLKVGQVYAKVHRLTHVPDDNDAHVERFANNCLREGKRILLKRYRRHLLKGSMGVRATVSQEDALRNMVHLKATRRVVSALVHLDDVRATIDLSKLPRDAEFNPHRKFIEDKVDPLVKGISQEVRKLGLLPPRQPAALPEKK